MCDRNSRPLLALGIALAWLVAAAAGRAQPPADAAAGAANRVLQAAEWELESIEFADGKQWQGLLLSETPQRLEFVEIVRQAGRPLYSVVRRIDPGAVVRRQRLSDEGHARLMRRYQSIRNHSRIELGRMDDVRLEQVSQEGVEYHVFAGEGFSLWSTADEEMTRRCVVRIDQIFRTYRQLLPPRATGARNLRVRLYASMDDYHGYLQRLGLEIANPAFYSASQNVIVAGSDLERYAGRLAQIRSQNTATLRHYDRVLNPRFDEELARLSKDLKSRGFGLEEVELRRVAWDREYQATLRRIAEVNRRNEAKFAHVTRRMFTRLYHEAFHAYLENHVYPRRDSEMPRWLNEGLAQIFEGGRLEADTLRVDAPSADRLSPLQADLRGENALPLTQLLQAEDHAFLVTHASESSARHYVYSWGLAHYLTFHHDLLGGESLDWYVSAEASRLPPVKRFERLVGMRVTQFEPRWRQVMLELRP